MKKFSILLVVLFVSAGAMAIVSPDVYMPFENTNGSYGTGYYAPGSGTANPAWDNVAASPAEQVNYVGATTATTWAVTNNVGGIKGDYMDITGNGTPGVDTFATLSYKFGTVSALSQAKSYTFTWWANTRDTTKNGSESYFFKQFGSGTPTVKWRGDGRLQAMVNGSWYYSGYHTTDSAGDWVFNALVVDSTSVRMYSGTEDTAVTMVQEATGLTVPALPTLMAADPTTTPFILSGYSYNATDKYAGYDMDEFRIYTSQADGTGALCAADIEAIRQYDVPEPMTMGILALGAGFIFRRKK
jgi:hypothetical protein